MPLFILYYLNFLLSRIARLSFLLTEKQQTNQVRDEVNAAAAAAVPDSGCVSLRWYHSAPCKYTQHAGLLHLAGPLDGQMCL